MNERIRELIAEADRKCSETRGIYDEILAKLIVKECACKIEEMIDNGWYADTEQLKKYFGVEE
jgi:hypothetical protein